MNQLTMERRVAIVSALTEGCSIRATSRMTGASKNTIAKLLLDLGAACAVFLDNTVRNVRIQRVQCDEIWAFCHAKAKNVPDSMRGQPGIGSVWTWLGMCADSKLILSFHVGTRDAECASEFMDDLASRLACRVQLTTDGHRPYLQAVEGAFGCDIDYAMLVKLYGNAPQDESRYSPPACIGARKEPIMGYPDEEHISTSYIERQNLTLRMSNRRFTRLTNAFSKKVENLEASMALYVMHYNFVRIHQTIRVTPAMESGLTSRVWSMYDLVGLIG